MTRSHRFVFSLMIEFIIHNFSSPCQIESVTPAEYIFYHSSFPIS